jgi:Flp pilus assembly protein TadG
VYEHPSNAPEGVRSRRAAALLVVLIFIPVMLGMAALTIDVGQMFAVRAELQHAADAAALAAANRVHSSDTAFALESLAEAIATRNHPGHGDVVSQFVLGHWNTDSATFIPGATPRNAVHVVTARTEETGNPVGLFFSPFFGKNRTSITASATAMATVGGPGVSTRFLLDNEVFDNGHTPITNYGRANGMTADEMLRDGDGDDFIDFPPGVIELPTGQVGDAGLFEIEAGFPFTSTSDPSLEDFLLYDENGDRRGISTGSIDPVRGVEPVYDKLQYPSFVNPDQVHVSPLYKSDLSDHNMVPGTVVKGERRGLVAFKIIGVGIDPDGNGSKLPNLIFEIIDPATVGPLGGLVLHIEAGTGTGMVQLVR